jgi:predicted RNase H-like HicB family nuclease
VALGRVEPFAKEAGMLTYTLKLADRYDGMIIATIPDVPEAMAIGRDIDEACDEARRVLETTLELYAAEGRPSLRRLFADDSPSAPIVS